MSLISRQYRPPSCSLEITAQLSPLSRWAKRPILKSVNFLLSFPELSGLNHEPLEIRGDHEQLQLLSETVADYTQHLLGQSLTASRLTPAASMASSLPDAAADAPPSQPYLRPRSWVSHDLSLGSLSTNASEQTVSLKASQLFDLVSALDDCTAELEILPLPSRRPALSVWASSAAVIVLMMGVTTATLQLTQHSPVTQRERESLTDANDVASEPVEGEGIASAPQVSPLPPSPTAPAQPPTPSSTSRPSAEADRRDQQESTATAPPIVARAPQPKHRSAKPQTLDNRQTRSNELSTPSQATKNSADQNIKSRGQDQGQDQSMDKRLRQPVAVAPSSPAPADSTADAKAVQPKVSSPPPAAAPPSSPAAEPIPETATAASAESALQESDRLGSQRSVTQNPARPQAGRQAPGRQESAYVMSRSSHALNIRQYLSQRWQVPTGLTQPLPYQLTLNANGSLKSVQPLNKAATQYLEQVPFPPVNRSFIAPLKSSQAPQVRLVLNPDGTVQVLERGTSNAAP
ncbi:DUF4335 domain-containing protein [Acaryochloris sp. IP29b_bin.148]|uniref:DUF4335 domain-containing protein n=1 Tax=Acaryochloris sp. IP29b_bin.148 TaxID=2969218 RepID=UPI00261C0BF3|nr:DUF4335 domain-containing protein [Acaryochloris sp. IP29b_bin.148]